MRRTLMNFFKTFFVINIVFLIFFNSACESTSVNKSIRIKDGEKVSGDISSVNGSIRIGKNCQIDGDCRTVNGIIEIGQNSVVDDIQTVNDTEGVKNLLFQYNQTDLEPLWGQRIQARWRMAITSGSGTAKIMEETDPKCFMLQAA